MSYVDTSVLVAYYCPEPLSPSAQSSLARIGEPVVSPLVEVELYSAVAAKVRARDLSPSSGGRILGLFSRDLADGSYRVVPIEAKEYSLARDWIARFSTPLRTLDALHLATAFSHDLTLLTADKRLAQSARRLGVKSRLIS